MNTTELESWKDAHIGDVVNIRTWMPRRAHLRNVVVIGKPMGPGYEGLMVKYKHMTSEMHIPGVTITHIETVDEE